jgi:hypothetical protein
LFHMPQDGEDDIKLTLDDYDTNPPSGEESSSEAANHPLQVKDDLIGSKDDVRKCHALLELLSTEVGYLFDLKVLVTVSRSDWPVLGKFIVARSSGVP